MASTHQGAGERRSFADTIWARLFALVIAAGLVWVFWNSWGDEVMALRDGSAAEIPLVSQPAPDANVTNPALEACLEKRVGDIDQMKADGVIGDAQYNAFRQRAEGLCRQQNPA